jgi:hypothetical protein
MSSTQVSEMMEGFVMCSLKKSINYKILLSISLVNFGTIAATTVCFNAVFSGYLLSGTSSLQLET